MDHSHGPIAFVVIIPSNGGVAFVSDQFPDEYRKPSLADVRRAGHDLVDDVNARAAAEYSQPKPVEPVAERVGRSVLKKKAK